MWLYVTNEEAERGSEGLRLDHDGGRESAQVRRKPGHWDAARRRLVERGSNAGEHLGEHEEAEGMWMQKQGFEPLWYYMNSYVRVSSVRESVLKD